jgi:hypothetical protein
MGMLASVKLKVVCSSTLSHLRTKIKSYRTVYYLVVSTDVKFVVSSEGYEKRVEIMGNIFIISLLKK